ncbi:hypothetical protein STEG23_021528 [Scotinomys teguina]
MMGRSSSDAILERAEPGGYFRHDEKGNGLVRNLLVGCTQRRDVSRHEVLMTATAYYGKGDPSDCLDRQMGAVCGRGQLQDPGMFSQAAVTLKEGSSACIDFAPTFQACTMRTCGLLPGWYGLTSQDLLTALQMFQNPDQLQDNWLKDEASQTAPVKIGASS